ncbi:hypothetical protein FACS18949_00990 [Clostridia bacterium]|nr:hypothetical protein FACS18949_00990 [Clostridia bacterium]
MLKKTLAFALALALVSAIAPLSVSLAAEPYSVKWLDGVDSVQGYSDGQFVVTNAEGEYAVIDKTGKTVVPYDKYWYIGAFNGGAAVIFDGSDYGVIDKAGSMVVPYGKYYAIEEFSDGAAVVYGIDKSIGVIDTSGKLIIPFGFTYDSIGDFSDGAATVRKGLEIGAIDKTGKLIVPLGEYSEIGAFNNGAAFATKAYSQTGAIDKTGKVVVPFGTYDYIYNFHDGVALVEKDDKVGVIDTTGKVVVPLGKYSGFSGGFSSGLCVVYDGEDWERVGVINTSGKAVVPLSDTHWNIHDFEGKSAVAVNEQGDDYLYGVISNAGKILVPLGTFDYISSLGEDGLFLVYSGNDKYILTLNNEPSGWAAGANGNIQKAKDLKLTTPELEKNYQSYTTRAEFSHAAVNFVEVYTQKTADALIAELGYEKKTFTDTADPVILAASSLKIISGYTDNTFGANDPVSREEAATMLANILKRVLLTDTSKDAEAQFTDLGDIQAYAKQAVNTVKSRGVMNGYSDTVFAPKSGYTHEESISTFYKLYKSLNN